VLTAPSGLYSSTACAALRGTPSNLHVSLAQEPGIGAGTASPPASLRAYRTTALGRV